MAHLHLTLSETPSLSILPGPDIKRNSDLSTPVWSSSGPQVEGCVRVCVLAMWHSVAGVASCPARGGGGSNVGPVNGVQAPAGPPSELSPDQRARPEGVISEARHGHGHASDTRPHYPATWCPTTHPSTLITIHLPAAEPRPEGWGLSDAAVPLLCFILLFRQNGRQAHLLF